MNVEERIKMLKMIERMDNHPELSKKLGLKVISKYQSKNKKEERGERK